LFVIGVFAGCGQAQAQRPNIEAFVQQSDTNHDGTLSWNEIKKAASARFEALDRKQEGRLTRNQLAGMVSYQQFRQIDKEGTLAKAEYLSLVGRLFKAADKDRNGTLDKKELGTPAGKALLRLFAARQAPML
jgi:Ca2+-binding EF-hand superfamily protein